MIFMAKALAETDLVNRFTEHDLRAKVASNEESLERAKRLLGHADSRITERVYRRKVEVIEPAARRKNHNLWDNSDLWDGVSKHKPANPRKMARSGGFEPPTAWFVARYSIQLSYERVSARH